MQDFNKKLEAFFSKVDNRVKHHVPNIIGETAVEYFKNSFITKSWDGVPWQPYQNKAREPKRGSLMMRSLALMNTVRAEYSPGRVKVIAGNSRVRYAQIHNEGGRVSGTRRVNPYVNRNFMGKGKVVRIRQHTRTVNYLMPKRQFMGKSPILLAQIKNRFTTTFKDF